MSNNDKVSTSGLHNPVVHVGTPSPNTQDEWVKTNVYFHGFADVPTATERVRSPRFYCLGQEWSLRLYPRGKKNSKSFAEGMISIYLYLHSNNTSVEIEYGFANNTTTRACTCTFTQNSSRGWKQFLKHEDALNCLVNGALVIEVRMKPVNHATPFVPENPSKHITVKDFFMDAKSADIVFEIRGDEHEVVGDKRRRNSSPSSKLYAHSLILSKAAPQLAELCKSNQSPQLIEIHDTSCDVFKDMLRYIYGCHISGFGKDISHTKQIIEVAHKYGVINLKLEAEALYVSSLTLTVENVMEHFHFAEAKNCAYLKEKTLDFIVNNKADIMKQKILSSAIDGPSSSDILAAVTMRSRDEKKDDNEFCSMSISELRRKAHAKGVDVDGSREMLISALERRST